MYTPHPIPTLAPDAASAYQVSFEFVDQFWNRILTTLASIPIIPNSQGLFDRNGIWLQPALSLLDVMVASIFLGAFFLLIFTLAGFSGNGMVSSALSGSTRIGSQKDLPPAEHFHMHQTYNEYKILNVRTK